MPRLRVAVLVALITVSAIGAAGRPAGAEW
jgi:hypothetical protein